MSTIISTKPRTARLHTRAAARRQASSVLATLRSLAPQRPLRWHELERIAELQANRLLELARISAPAVQIEVISGLPRIEVRQVVDLPVGGSADWVGGRWIVSVAGGDSPARQRYSIAHEFKHIVDHPVRQVIFAGATDSASEAQAERIAEYFAACLLMPKRLVVRLWGQGVQRLSELSERFEVSPRAMQIRLWQLGLVDPAPRCPSARAFLTPVRGPLT